MKKFLLLTVAVMALVLAFTGCGKNESDEESTTEVTEETTEETTDEYAESTTEDDDIIHPKNKNDDSDDENSDDIINPDEDSNGNDEDSNKNDSSSSDSKDGVIDNPEATKASQVDNVSNKLFVEVSNAVRGNCNSSNTSDGSSYRSKWSSMETNSDEKTFANTGADLINSYSRLNNCRKLIYANNDVITDDDIKLLTTIEDDLSANVEIFLNAESTSVLSGDFSCSNQLSDLELSINNRLS